MCIDDDDKMVHNESKEVIVKSMFYKETGGLNWCLCKVIAEYDGKVWLHNLHTGSMPVKRKTSCLFREVEDHLKQCKGE